MQIVSMTGVAGAALTVWLMTRYFSGSCARLDGKDIEIASLRADLALVKNDRERFHDLWTSTEAKLADEKEKSTKAFDDLAAVVADRNAINAKWGIALSDLADTKFELSRWREWHGNSPAAAPEPSEPSKGVES